MNLATNKENYCGTIVKITELYPLKDCDNVVGTKIFGSQVIIPRGTPLNEMGVYFPAGSKLSDDFIKYNNLSRYPELNVDGEKKGYFEKNNRVKAVLFRKQESNGFYMPLHCLSYLLSQQDLNSFKVGQTFNEIDGVEVVTKYLPTKGKSYNASTTLESLGVVDGEFALHRDTKHFAQNLSYITMDSKISVTLKHHGTSAVVGKVLANKKLSIVEKIKKFFGFAVQTQHHIGIAASRGVIKNPSKKIEGFDLWVDNANKILPNINNGTSVYGEIVGYYPDGKLIQKGYDYGCNQGEYEFYVYRVVRNTNLGAKLEVPYDQLKLYFKNDVKTVPVRFSGMAVDLAKEFGCDPQTDEELQQCLFNGLKNEIEIFEPTCKNKVPREGYVVRVENSPSKPAFKMKSFLFLKYEDEQMDKGDVDVETEQT